MPNNLVRIYLIELVGTFGLVYFSAAVAIMNLLAIPADMPAGTSPLNLHQSGLVGVAVAQGLIYGVLLSLTVPCGGGFLNPALAVAMWGFNRYDSRRLAWIVGAQLLGSFLAAVCLRFTFDLEFLKRAQFGSVHLNLLAYNQLDQSARFAGAGVELVLTFFLAFAIFGADRVRPSMTGWAGGATLIASVLAGYSLTGAALNPARWFGPVVLDAWMGTSSVGRVAPFADALVYLAGPILGAIAGAAFTFLVYLPALAGQEAAKK